MTKITYSKCEDGVHRWVNEYGHRVCIFLADYYGFIQLGQDRYFSINLTDPKDLVNIGLFDYKPYIQVNTDSHNITTIFKAVPSGTPESSDPYDYKQIREVELLDEHRRYFGVILHFGERGSQQYTMNDYYKLELYKA